MNINLDKQTFSAIRQLAEAEERTMVGQIRWLIRFWMKTVCKESVSPAKTKVTGNEAVLRVLYEEKFLLKTSDIKDLVQDKFDCDLVNYSGAIYSLRKRGYVSTNNHLHSLTEKGKLKAKGLMFE